MQAAGYVLVGGNSSRMGRDKALLPGQFRYVVDDIAKRVKAVTGSVVLIGDPDRYHELQYPCIGDIRPGSGPLSGLEAALLGTSNNLNLVLACDMPAVDVTHLLSLIERALVSESNCVATRDASGRVHPLCAVYKKDCLPVIQCRLDENRLSLMGLLDEVRTEYLGVQSVIENINTPEEWARWTSAEHNDILAGWQSLT
jgi:molybdopterin-guanine dinucleotide biosynthesis protein A